ncbi:hypothetical protein AVEN_147043-1 [Araneus ventricosus]|uniref:STPR domain-containing protein n=1 Tax=Araneus ventricosus TaxID=182803 RepID=A0A4Y2SUI2_ARAVE|nr:hypothetical protein AVEN_147043-1 [Araneus ventricosus]
MAQRGQRRRAEETDEQRNSRLAVMGQRSQERRAEGTDEQRNSRLSAMLIFGSYYFCFVQFSLFPMPKRKRGITGDADSRREAIRKRERRVVEKLREKEIADSQTWPNVAMREEPKKQKDKEIADCQPWYNMQENAV